MFKHLMSVELRALFSETSRVGIVLNRPLNIAARRAPWVQYWKSVKWIEDKVFDLLAFNLSLCCSAVGKVR